MIRATIVDFFVASVLVFFVAASREGENNSGSDVAMAVGLKSLTRLAEVSSEKGHGEDAANSALSQLRVQPEENRAAAFAIKKAGALPSAEADAGSTMQQVAAAASGLSAVGEGSKALREALAELERDSGLEGAAREAEDRIEQHKADARSKLKQVAVEWQDSRRQVDELGSKLKAVHTRLTSTDGGSAEDDRIDAQFVQLEEDTKHVMSLFNEIKQLKSERDAIKAKKKSAVETAVNAGITPKQIETDLKRAAKAKDVATTDKSTGDEKGQELMSKTAGEMLQIMHAADEVTAGLDAMNGMAADGHASSKDMADAKERIAKAVGYLEKHKDLPAERMSQIKSLTGHTAKAEATL